MVTTRVSLDGVQTADSQNPITDLSGADTSVYDNPYDALLNTDVCTIGHDDFGKFYMFGIQRVKVVAL